MFAHLSAIILAAATATADIARPPEAAPQVGAVRSFASALARFSATDLDGQRWTAADLRGRVLLVDFWATWCAPCLAELPRLKALRARHSRDEFEILGISLDPASRQSLVSWLNRNRIDWPQVHERAGYSGQVARLLDVDRLPRTILIDRHGEIAAVDLRGDRLEAAINDLVVRRAGQPPSEGRAR